MDGEERLSDFDRRTIGAIFGALVGIAFIWGFTGGWDWLYLRGIPGGIDYHAHISIMSLGAMIGWFTGLLIAWPRTVLGPNLWKSLFLILGLSAVLSGITSFPRVQEAWVYVVFFIMVLTPAFAFISLSLSLVKRAMLYNSAMLPLWALLIGICLLLCTALATWPIDQVQELWTGRRAIINKAAEIANEMDWEVIHYEVLVDKSASILRFMGIEYQHSWEVRLTLLDGHYRDCESWKEHSMYCPAVGIVP
jgi:hypothetical protein